MDDEHQNDSEGDQSPEELEIGQVLIKEITEEVETKKADGEVETEEAEESSEVLDETETEHYEPLKDHDPLPKASPVRPHHSHSSSGTESDFSVPESFTERGHPEDEIDLDDLDHDHDPWEGIEGGWTEHEVTEPDLEEDDTGFEYLLDKRATFEHLDQIQQQPSSTAHQVDSLFQGALDIMSLLAPEAEPEPEIVPLTSEQEFEQEYMTIPEEPAAERMSQEAAATTSSVTRARDPCLKYLEDQSLGEKYVSTAEVRMARCPSVESLFCQLNVVNIQFYLFPGHRMISSDCRLDTTIFQLKLGIGRYVKVPPANLDMRRDKSLVADEKTLQELGAKTGRKMKFTVEINKRVAGNYEIAMPQDHTKQLKPTKNVVIKVKVDGKDGSVHYVNVTIIHAHDPKPMLGGFIDQRTGLKYHHAATMVDSVHTPLRRSQASAAVQVYGTKVSGQQTLLDKAQQMPRSGLYLAESKDRVLKPRPYHSYDYWQKKRDKSARIIQRYWRRSLAIKERRWREDGLIKRVNLAENIRKGRLEQRKLIMSEETERQLNPKRLVDLELLYRAINNWRKEEEEFVNENRWGAERKAAMASLTDLESDLLLDLGRTKIKINEREREHRNQRCFDMMGKPKRWLSAKTNNFITVDDGAKVRVRQLQHIHNQLQAPVENSHKGLAGRCALLEQLNFMTRNINTKMSQMLTELVSRELTFLRMPKCSFALLSGVRRRISSTFFFLCRDPVFNPESKRVQKVPWDPVKLRKEMIQCKGCRRMQCRDEFTIVRGTTVTSRCHTCMDLYRTAILRVDLNLYRHMLKELRKDELAAGVVNSVTFLIDAFDLQFLVDQNWHGQSALSGIDNRYILRLCRWIKDKPWAPWNCVLLTEEEATAHLQLEDMASAYKSSFFHKVSVKQCTAKTYFEGIAKLTIGLDERISENCKMAEVMRKRQMEIKQKVQKKAKLFAMLKTE